MSGRVTALVLGVLVGDVPVAGAVSATFKSGSR